MRRTTLVLLVALLSAALTGCIQVGPFAPTRLQMVVIEKSPYLFERDSIAVIDIEGFIGTGSIATGFGGTSVADVKEKLDLAAADTHVKAIVLRLDSPGGEVTASDMIYHEIVRFRRTTGKPVVAYMMSTATSGAYYCAVAADEIIASPTAVTGSVGVIMTFVNVETMFQKLGIKEEVIKSGENKDIGSPFRAMKEEERVLLQQINAELFERFLGIVQTERSGMTDEQLATLSDGRIVTAQQALALNAIDKVDYFQASIEAAKQHAGIRSADVILYRARPSYNNNIYAAAGTPALLRDALDALSRRAQPAFLYLWRPQQ